MREDKKLAATSGSAIGISAIASFIGLCCIGPWAVALLGVSGAVAMAKWQPFRPYILGLAVVMSPGFVRHGPHYGCKAVCGLQPS